MMVAGTDILLSWSGGKDSALALLALREQGRAEPVALLTTVTEGYERVSMHGVRRQLVRSQAAAVGAPWSRSRSRRSAATTSTRRGGWPRLPRSRWEISEEVAFGDLVLEDFRAYRESRLAAVGKRGQFPVCCRDTHELAHRFLADRLRAIVVCVDPRLLDRSFAGREYDERLLADLPPNVDPCGENGEFHTFVYPGPIFRSPLRCRRGATVERDGFVVRPPRPGRMIVEAHVCSLLPRRPPLVREEFELRGERDRGPREPAQVSSPQPAHVPTQGRPFESVRPAS
jgi:uncharacterized protein (TIGR00290 family)